MSMVSVRDFRVHLSDYIARSQDEDIYITNRDEIVAVLSSPEKARKRAFEELDGCLEGFDINEMEIQNERISKI